MGHEGREARDEIAVARLEQLYPFPVGPYDELLSRYPNLKELLWVQEEPQNMGAWRAVRHRLEEGLPSDVQLRYCGRAWRASPSEGYPTAHLLEQDRIVSEALTSRPGVSRPKEGGRAARRPLPRRGPSLVIASVVLGCASATCSTECGDERRRQSSATSSSSHQQRTARTAECRQAVRGVES